MSNLFSVIVLVITLMVVSYTVGSWKSTYDHMKYMQSAYVCEPIVIK